MLINRMPVQMNNIMIRILMNYSNWKMARTLRIKKINSILRLLISNSKDLNTMIILRIFSGRAKKEEGTAMQISKMLKSN
jgi:hypothetical protein